MIPGAIAHIVDPAVGAVAAAMLERLPAMSEAELELASRAERINLARPQTPTTTYHLFHAGIYSRSVMIEAGRALTGALIKIPTIVTICGDCEVYVGELVRHVRGYQVIPAAAGRKQLYVAHGDTWVSMSFRTAARTVEAAEAEFTDEAGRLFSRRWPNVVVITDDEGETL